jgi:hypothetical protein
MKFLVKIQDHTCAKITIEPDVEPEFVTAIGAEFALELP